ncbi:zinc finger protein 836-like isoform X2 [Armigeres subalbatus]|uniref:zinc finger protein 836-like isoform X2 n=1 Tax=Armigeres subalbatus TaxID=124917 RepID=UPI002ED5EE4C
MELEPQLCRLCLVPVDPATVVVLNQAVGLIESILQLTTINVIIDRTRSVFMCDQCRNMLDLSIQFRMMCLQNDETFRKMYAEHALSLNTETDVSDNCEAEFVDCKIETEISEVLEKLEPEITIQDNKVLKGKRQASPDEFKKRTLRRKLKATLNTEYREHDEQRPTKGVKAKKKRKKIKAHQKSTTGNQGEKTQCQICGEFYSRDVLRKHLLIHKADRPMYSCDQCPKKYPHRKNLREHIEIVHEGKADHTCDKCGKTYNRKDALNKHYIAEHTDLKNFECKVCFEKFSRSSALAYHNKMKHSSLRPHACTYCEMTFKRSNDLVLHVRTHTGEKPFKCDLCDKRFAKSYNVVIHKKSHRNAELRKAAQLKTEASGQCSDLVVTSGLE